MDLNESDLAGLNLTGFDLRKANLNRANLSGTTLADVDLSGATIICPITERLRAQGLRLQAVYSHATAYQVADLRNSSWRNARDVTGALFHGCDLRGADLSGAILSGALFYQCELEGANFASADLAGCVFNECVVAMTSFVTARMQDVVFLQSSITGTSFNRCHAQRIHFNAIRAFKQCSFDAASMDQAAVDQSELEAISFHNTNLEGAVVRNSVLRSVDFTSAHAPNATFLRVTFSNMIAVNAEFSGASWIGATCERGAFSGSTLENSRFDSCSFADVTFSASMRASLRRLLFDGSAGRDRTRVLHGVKARAMIVRNSTFVRCDFSGAYLYRAMFTGDHVKRLAMNACNFSDAVLVQSYLSGSFVGARFRRAELAYARLNQSDLRCADFTNANMFEASLVKVDVSGATLRNVSPPVFIDRARGLGSPSTRLSARLRQFIASLEDVLKDSRRRST